MVLRGFTGSHRRFEHPTKPGKVTCPASEHRLATRRLRPAPTADGGVPCSSPSSPRTRPAPPARTGREGRAGVAVCFVPATSRPPRARPFAARCRQPPPQRRSSRSAPPAPPARNRPRARAPARLGHRAEGDLHRVRAGGEAVRGLRPSRPLSVASSRSTRSGSFSGTLVTRPERRPGRTGGASDRGPARSGALEPVATRERCEAAARPLPPPWRGHPPRGRSAAA